MNISCNTGSSFHILSCIVFLPFFSVVFPFGVRFVPRCFFLVLFAAILFCFALVGSILFLDFFPCFFYLVPGTLLYVFQVLFF